MVRNQGTVLALASDFVDYSDPSEMPRARRNPARTAPTERAAPKATADGTALPLFSKRRKRAADGNRTYTEKETKRK